MQNISFLFTPYTFNNGVTVKNRLAVAPMTHWGSGSNGQISLAEQVFLTGRAEDFGLFITAATLVSLEGKAFDGQPYACSHADLPSLKNVANIIQKQGAKAILQIHHGGKLAIAELLNGHAKVAPSADIESQSNALTETEIIQLISAFGQATELAIEAGFDGVEIHGANGYLIQQFFSGHSNRREDQWGGSIEKRLTFPLKVIEAVLNAKAKHHRPDFIVGYRFSPEEPEENGITMTDTFTLIDMLVQQPLQYLHISLHDFFVHARRGADTQRMRIAQVHERIGGKLPLIGVGNLLTAEQIDRAIATRCAEFIGLGKSVLLNPNMATLLKKGDFDQIQTELDITRKADYRFPERLWQLSLQQLPFLPKLKA